MPTTLRTLRSLAVVALCVTIAGGATAAPRHTKLLKSEPAANDTLTAPPKQIALVFSERIDLKVSRFKLAGTKGAVVTLGAATVDEAKKGAPIVIPVTGAMGPGAYTVNWTVASDDGHAVKGTFGFVVK